VRGLTIVLVGLALLAGCARSPAPTLHALLPQAHEPPATTRDDGRLRIVIATTLVPQSIDRPQLLVQDARGGLTLADGERWAEPLKRAIPRALAYYLSADLDGAIVWSAGSAAPARADARILLEVTRWESVLGRHAASDVLWTVRTANGEHSGRTTTDVPVQGSDYAALVAAHRDALRRVSRDIAAGIQGALAPAQ
jgi:uncharacterized lipoprotein YmbA